MKKNFSKMASSNALNELSTQKSFSIVQTENLNQQPMPEKGEEFIIQDEDLMIVQTKNFQIPV